MALPFSSDIGYSNYGMQHPNPMFDYLTTFAPRKLKSLFLQCEYLFFNSPQVFAALTKFAVYPITKINYEDDNAKLRDRYKTLMEKHIKLRERLTVTGIDKFVYGNSFISMYFPFTRFLVCPECKSKHNIKKTKYKFKVKKKRYGFYFTCPNCKHTGKATVHDEKLRLRNKISVIRWDPKYIDIVGNQITGENVYYYEIPESIKERIRRGDEHLLATIPLGFIDTIARRKIFKFAPGKVYHSKFDAPAGVDRSWGLPPLLAVLKQFLYTAVLRKANEAIALEHVVPFRVMHPAQSTASADPTVSISLSNWMRETKMNLEAWRRDPLHLMFSPVPIGVTNVGGQGRALMVTGEITESENSIIAGLGVPREFIYGGLSATGSGVTLRMLENQLLTYTTDKEEEAQWISDQCGKFLGWRRTKLKMEPFKLVDDVQQKNLVLQANQISGGTLMSNTSLANMLEIDLRKERKLRMQEAVEEAKHNMELEKRMEELKQNMASKAQAAAGAENNALPAGNQQALIGEADKLVEQMMQMDEGTRKSYLHAMQTEDYVMYCLLIQRWEEMQTQQQAVARSDMREQGAAV